MFRNDLTTAQFVKAAYRKAFGKNPTFTSGSDKWNLYVDLGNDKIDAWQNENGVDWFSLYDPSYTLTTVSNTDTYDLDSNIKKISPNKNDSIQILNTNGTISKFELVSPNELQRHPYGNYVARVGSSIKFNRVFQTTDLEYGGTIVLPIFNYSKYLSTDSSKVPVDNPQWLVVITAAEVVRNDVVKQNQYSNLISEANALMGAMKQDNDDAQETTVDMPWNPIASSWS